MPADDVACPAAGVVKKEERERERKREAGEGRESPVDAARPLVKEGCAFEDAPQQSSPVED